MFGREKIELKTPDEVRLMRRAGLVVADALDAVLAHAAPGVTTAELDAVAAEVIAATGATPSFLGYLDYPATICVSVNDEVVHGIPGPRVLAEGDVLSVDCGAVVEGWHGDAARTRVVGTADPADAELVATGEDALWAGIAALAGGERLGAVGEAVETVVELAATAGRNGGQPYGIVEEYVGHGIGRAMHQPPDVLNYRARDKGPRLRPGMCLAIEPMLVRGARYTRTLDDEWTVVTEDGSRAVHWEHTVALLPGGVWVLTARDGGADRLAALGVRVVPL
ncbi:type I methionyl aminopeptidase [Cellulomonas marina]|uniref:Methionine aminopeptidase n=1 Tax=Cellulomonas marina TaxID=988821 RepID=A0A1I0XNL6_9CELL|nr:type I methionyl aminopeptidase [Cellulomonas marina]GIG30655.1 methionine aminopeptidase [Cellulomonas marina]SFB02494.1 methionyl aminopeptidase [Cellulomonas marina]